MPAPKGHAVVTYTIKGYNHNGEPIEEIIHHDPNDPFTRFIVDWLKAKGYEDDVLLRVEESSLCSPEKD
jgi:hypothetical protein